MENTLLKTWLKKDTNDFNNGLTYYEKWAIIGHVAALEYIVQYYHEDIFFSEDNARIIEKYINLGKHVESMLANPNAEQNIYNVAKVYEHKTIYSAHERFHKHFSVQDYFYKYYVDVENVPTKLKDDGVFCSEFIRFVKDFFHDFDFSNLRYSVLYYYNRIREIEAAKEEYKETYINNLKAEANMFLKNISSASLEDVAYMAGKTALFLHYDCYTYLKSTIVETFYVCKSKLPHRLKNNCHVDNFISLKKDGKEAPLGDLSIFFEKGLNDTLIALFHSYERIKKVEETLYSYYHDSCWCSPDIEHC